MMATLLLRLDGPLQAWGVDSRYARRDTLDHPSKSGVVGLCAAALGRRRAEPIDDLAALRFGVAVVDPGRLLEDYHSASNVVRSGVASRVDLSPAAIMRSWSGAEIRRAGVPRGGDVTGALKSTELTWRRYLADAMFVAGLEGDRGLLASVADRLEQPVFPLALGRAACLPCAPVAFTERADSGLLDTTLEHALESLAADARDWIVSRHPADQRERRHRREAQRLVVECPPADATLQVRDQPVGAGFASREFGIRYARVLPMPEVGDA